MTELIYLFQTDIRCHDLIHFILKGEKGHFLGLREENQRQVSWAEEGGYHRAPLASHHVDELDELQAHGDLHDLAVVFHWPHHAAVVLKQLCHQAGLMFGAQDEASCNSK